MHPAVLDEREDRGVAHAGFVRSEKEPVFLADGRGPDRVLDEIIIDFHFAKVEESRDRFTLVQSIASPRPWDFEASIWIVVFAEHGPSVP